MGLCLQQLPPTHLPLCWQGLLATASGGIPLARACGVVEGVPRNPLLARLLALSSHQAAADSSPIYWLFDPRRPLSAPHPVPPAEEGPHILDTPVPVQLLLSRSQAAPLCCTDLSCTPEVNVPTPTALSFPGGGG